MLHDHDIFLINIIFLHKARITKAMINNWSETKDISQYFSHSLYASISTIRLTRDCSYQSTRVSDLLTCSYKDKVCTDQVLVIHTVCGR